MSKLRTYELQNPDSASVNIELTPSGGTILSGVVTATTLKVGTGVTISSGVVTATSFSGPLTGNVTGNLTGNVTGNLTGNLQSTASLAGISSSISDTATDIFVYDTRKDSDGGAWRKRTQHTSWYNETLNTATRGSRREFPAVAVIVAETSSITIYDGDDPDLPMWMVFENAGVISWSHDGTSVISTISILNGVFVFGLNDGNGGIYLNFVKDNMRAIFGNGNLYDLIGFTREIINRNQSFSYTNNPFGDGINIVNSIINDLAMTVLPNAPIDDATGLPIPTIAVATDGGVSVIRDDGNVVDLTRSGYTTDFVDFINYNGTKLICYNNNTTLNNEIYSPGIFEIPISDADFGNVVLQRFNSTSAPIGLNAVNEEPTAISKVDKGNSAGLTRIYLQGTDFNSQGQSSVAYATTSYNTGWMHGDIKGAFLSDTDATNVTGTELITNGTFDSDVSGWTTVTSTITYNSGAANIARNGGAATNAIYQNISGLTIGEKYLITIKITALSNLVSVYFDPDGSESAVEPITATATGTYTAIYTATQTSGIFSINATASSSATATVDNISMRVAEEDRSVNNKGLQVFGTVTKSAVATGAELVAYSNFSTSNYLLQPNNTDLDYGTGDFYYMGWFYNTSVSARQIIFRRNLTNGTLAAGRVICSLETDGNFFFGIEGGGTNKDLLTTSWSQNVWNHFCVVRSGTNFNLYINGVVKNSETETNYSVTCTNAVLTVGILADDLSLPATTTSIALLRTGASAPSAEQIKKIYEDEKVLFQENAACTLHGSSDAVTALAYDDSTNLLYAGTSSGRSDFQGLRRINNTTTAVTTAISASNGLVAEQ